MFTYCSRGLPPSQKMQITQNWHIFTYYMHTLTNCYDHSVKIKKHENLAEGHSKMIVNSVIVPNWPAPYSKIPKMHFSDKNSAL